MIRVKICGITNLNDANLCVSLGAWALGFIFYKKSPRYIGPDKAKKIIESLPPFLVPVGVFVNQEEESIKDIAHFCGIRTLQFHGEETPRFCKKFKQYKIIKTFRVRDDFNLKDLRNYPVDAFLFDSYKEGLYGGTGTKFSWGLIKSIHKLKQSIILSGGLNASNVNQAIEEINPYAVDLASGVEEAPGIKSPKALREFFKKIYQ